jgi:hypothetical protein
MRRRKLPKHIIRDEFHLSPQQVRKLFAPALQAFVDYQERNHFGDWDTLSIFNEFDFACYEGRLYAVGNAGYGDGEFFNGPNTYRCSRLLNRWRDLQHNPPDGMIDPEKLALVKSA